MQEQTYFGKGKLLLTGEYFVLDGALALALPTSLGQKLTISPRNDGVIHKMSVDNLKKCWYLGIFDPKTLQILEYKDAATSKRLQQIFTAIRELKPDFLKNTTGVTIKTELDFPRDWGLGTSSTLVYTLAKWADVNPFDLLKKTFGGSGYDIACAEAEGSIFYQINRNNGRPRWATVDFDPTFKDQLYFVYLGQKQNSREGIKRYREMKINGKAIETISKISALLPKVKTLE